jgi:hypothetical protein
MSKAVPRNPSVRGWHCAQWYNLARAKPQVQIPIPTTTTTTKHTDKHGWVDEAAFLLILSV